MSHQRKVHIETRRESAQRDLTARLEMLKAQGLDEVTIQRDATVRQIRASIRHARRQTARIAEIEALDLKKAEAREQKRNAPREDRPKVKKAVQGDTGRKAKREKKSNLAAKGE